ncbi:hypothetical protein LCGC14_0467860 [marine sediment metagenome]|uniref:Uncharacterized protein n=1 Tax=marine sediment metagenome TaxID=412755 RepID=A0A0F9SIE9_9ZZZZ|nr:hypothetical protein [Methylophaga sp.]HEC58779.1 hypothetical protein [Methylophaga sp.]
MDEKVKASWERALHPETLKTNIITASIFSMAFEMAIDPEAYPKDLDLELVTPAPLWSLQVVIDVALGTEEEARK